MKPKPFSSLNHFTVPLAITSSVDTCAADEGTMRADRRAPTLLRRARGLCRYLNEASTRAPLRLGSPSRRLSGRKSGEEVIASVGIEKARGQRGVGVR